MNNKDILPVEAYCILVIPEVSKHASERFMKQLNLCLIKMAEEDRMKYRYDSLLDLLAGIVVM